MVRWVLCVLAVAAADSPAKPVFDYTFAANCPVCRSYGNSTLKELFDTPGVAEGVDFQMHLAIRKGFAGYQCVSEAPGCPMTRYFLCAQHMANSSKSMAPLMAFVTCFNSQPSVKPLDAATLEQRAKSCSDGAFTWADLSTCYSQQGEKLQEEAERYFTTRYPEFSHAGFGPFGVPHVYINGLEVGPKGWAEKVDYDHTLKLLCDAGLQSEKCTEATLLV